MGEEEGPQMRRRKSSGYPWSGDEGLSLMAETTKAPGVRRTWLHCLQRESRRSQTPRERNPIACFAVPECLPSANLAPFLIPTAQPLQDLGTSGAPEK